MQEYCNTSTSGDSFRDFTRIVRNRFRSRDQLRPYSSEFTSSPRVSTPRDQSFKVRRQQCCELPGFVDNKPRPAPVFQADTADQAIAPTPESADHLPQFEQDPGGKQAGSPSGQLQPITMTSAEVQMKYRPFSTQPAALSSYQLPTRSASEDQELGDQVRYYSPANQVRSPLSPTFGDRTGDTKLDQEHSLIAHYSRELRQKSDMDLSAGFPVSGTNLMNRSTISDGPTVGPDQVHSDLSSATAPCVSPTGLRTGHLSLDRNNLPRSGRVLGGMPPSALPQDGHPAYLSMRGLHAYAGSATMGPLGYDAGQVEYGQSPQTSYSHTATSIYQQSSMRDPTYEPCIPNVKRSYSLRARSQPPPEVQQLSSVRPGLNAQFYDWRSPWYRTNISVNYPMQQVATPIEIERPDLDQYSRRQSSENQRQVHSKSARSYPAYSLYQKPTDQVRSPSHRSFMPRMLRLPLPSPNIHQGALPSGQMAVPGRTMYTGSLGRANQLPAANGLRYSGEMYNSEPRVAIMNSPAYNQTLDNGTIDYAPVLVAGEKANEARRLREHKDRLEARMQLLEEQNRQLSSTMLKLRQHIDAGATGQGDRQRQHNTSGTLGSSVSDVLADGVDVKDSQRQGYESGGIRIDRPADSALSTSKSGGTSQSGATCDTRQPARFNSDAVFSPAEMYQSVVKRRHPSNHCDNLDTGGASTNGGGTGSPSTNESGLPQR